MYRVICVSAADKQVGWMENNVGSFGNYYNTLPTNIIFLPFLYIYNESLIHGG